MEASEVLKQYFGGFEDSFNISISSIVSKQKEEDLKQRMKETQKKVSYACGFTKF